MKDSKIMYITVNKGIKTKFILNHDNGYKNPAPGTVIDHSITKKDMYDFYLVATNCK